MLRRHGRRGFIRQNRVVMKDEPPVFSSGTGPRADSHPLTSLLETLRPPAWVVDEVQNRVVLFLNHVLQQEPAATDRLRRQKGKAMLVRWNDISLVLVPTAAGLLERGGPDTRPELTMTLAQPSPLAIAQSLMAGQKPAVDIQGDVQLAAEVAWLVDNVRWDVEEDLAKVIGDAPAHTLGRFAAGAAQALRAFLERLPRPPGATPPGGGATP